jgi:predicted small metal-binding protein
VLGLVTAHAGADHGLTTVPQDLVDAVRAAIVSV